MAGVQYGHSHGDLNDDESLFDDDLIEADDGMTLSCILLDLSSFNPLHRRLIKT